MNFFMLLPDEILSLILVTLNKKQLIKFIKVYPSFQLNENLWLNMLYIFRVDSNGCNLYNGIYKNKMKIVDNDETTYYTTYLSTFMNQTYQTELRDVGNKFRRIDPIIIINRDKNLLIKYNAEQIIGHIIEPNCELLYYLHYENRVIDNRFSLPHLTTETQILKMTGALIFQYLLEHNYTFEKLLNFSYLMVHKYDSDPKVHEDINCKYDIEYKILYKLCKNFIKTEESLNVDGMITIINIFRLIFNTINY